MSFSSRLKERREFLGMSRNDMAEKLNITPSAIGNYENAISSPKEEILYKIFEVLDVEPNYLWQDEIKKNITDFSCSYPEQNMIKKYRALDEHGTKIVDSVLNEEYNRVVSEPEKERKYTMSDVQRLLNEYEDKENKKLTLVAHGAFSDTVTVTEEQLKRAKEILDSGDY